jgi:hypothetical protein
MRKERKKKIVTHFFSSLKYEETIRLTNISMRVTKIIIALVTFKWLNYVNQFQLKVN